MAQKVFINGNHAVAYGVKLARAQFIAAYPITPQTKIVEQLSEFISEGEMEAEFIKAESEHSAMTACYAASCTGVRSFTATSSQGLLYMYEMMQFTSGARRPVVMVNVNRAISAPWTIWLDHQDSMSTRDSGWMQIYVESAQEALDTIIQCFKVAENPEIMTPIMLCMDAFVLSHTNEGVIIPEQAAVDQFIPQFHLPDALDVKQPLTVSAGVGPSLYTELRYAQQTAVLKAKEEWNKTDREYGELVGRSYGGVVENYRCDDAEVVLISMGSISSTAKDVVDSLREQGQKVGLSRIRLYRPFPKKELLATLKSARAIGIIDRSISFGYEGPLFADVKAALYNHNFYRPAKNYIAGLGGRDISSKDIKKIYLDLLELSVKEKADSTVEFIGMRWQV